MYRQRLARTVVILGFLLAACGQSHANGVTAGGEPPAATDTVSTTESTTTSSTTTSSTTTTTEAPPPSTEAPPDTASAVPQPSDEVPPPQPAVITVTYQAHDGGTATATLVETGVSLPLVGGSVDFTGLPDGTYTVQIQVVYPGDNSGDIGIAAQSAFRTHPVSVHAGDHAVIACDDTDCTGIS
jgi:hypothetical protein